jgi:hypothetical protein
MGMGNNRDEWRSRIPGNENGSIREGFGRVSIRKMELGTVGETSGGLDIRTVIGNNGRYKGRSGYRSIWMENIRIDNGKSAYQGMGIGNIRRDKGKDGYSGNENGKYQKR